ncbi:glycosyltransferase family 9 protein [Georgenia thermotolerans]|uniref:Glycosyltransferase family 9 protein n=1 Tax=Georgenia thermotolerans TaxID=527326 RepID=A0A7J5UIL4_9MICO|nr:glycosyltransferase family 9 protein [Georgenia thermotolerans]KAE8762218.1 glycosyltransferase family 9 protein [Georgenia thermotolerans]
MTAAPGSVGPDDAARFPDGDVLVLRALGLGDALTGIAPLRGVRRAWPRRRIVLAAPAGVGGWLRSLGVVDAVLPTAAVDSLDGVRLDPAGLRPGHVAVNLHGRGPQSHRVLAETGPARLVAFANADAGHDGPPWRAGEHEVARWCRLVSWAGGPCDAADLRLPTPGGPRTAVVLHPGAASPARRWPVRRWSALARRLVEAGHRVLLTGSAAEAGLCTQVIAGAASAGATSGASMDPPGADAPAVSSLAGRLDLPGLADVVGRARLLVCGDTGVAHLATALGTPSVLLFGPVSPAAWGPAVDPHLHTVLWHGDGAGDPHAHAVDPALEAIGTDEAWDAVERALAAVAA